LREQLQLAGRAAALAFETRLRQAGLFLGALDERVAERGDAVGDAVSGTLRYASNALAARSHADATFSFVPLPKTGAAMSSPVAGLNARRGFSVPRTAWRPISISPVICISSPEIDGINISHRITTGVSETSAIDLCSISSSAW
jgi:hypothetical protein